MFGECYHDTSNMRVGEHILVLHDATFESKCIPLSIEQANHRVSWLSSAIKKKQATSKCERDLQRHTLHGGLVAWMYAFASILITIAKIDPKTIMKPDKSLRVLTNAIASMGARGILFVISTAFP